MNKMPSRWSVSCCTQRASSSVPSIVTGSPCMLKPVATARGARTLTGGTRDAHGGTFYTPTVMVDVPADALLAREETFGPVAGLVRFHTDEEAYRLANDTPYGLAAYVYSRDVGRLWRAAEALEYGMVGANTGIFSTAVAPFGGVKESGFGREGSYYGLEEWLNVKYLCLGL